MYSVTSTYKKAVDEVYVNCEMWDSNPCSKIMSLALYPLNQVNWLYIYEKKLCYEQPLSDKNISHLHKCQEMQQQKLMQFKQITPNIWSSIAISIPILLELSYKTQNICLCTIRCREMQQQKLMQVRQITPNIWNYSAISMPNCWKWRILFFS